VTVLLKFSPDSDGEMILKIGSYLAICSYLAKLRRTKKWCQFLDHPVCYDVTLTFKMKLLSHSEVITSCSTSCKVAPSIFSTRRKTGREVTGLVVRPVVRLERATITHDGAKPPSTGLATT